MALFAIPLESLWYLLVICLRCNAFYLELLLVSKNIHLVYEKEIIMVVYVLSLRRQRTLAKGVGKCAKDIPETSKTAFSELLYTNVNTIHSIN